MNKTPWNKWPSVTTGGKPHFYKRVIGDNVQAIVWNRAVRAYACESHGKLIEYVSTVGQGKALLDRLV